MKFQLNYSFITLLVPSILVQSFHIPVPLRTLPLSTTRRYFSTTGNVVTRLENSSVSIAIPVPGDATKAAYDKVCTELSKTIQIPGFRKGSKLPPQILEQTMAAKGGRNALKVQAINELISILVEPALREQSLDPIGQPRLSPSAEVLAESYTPGEPLSLTVECDVWPEITWKGQYQTDLSGTYQRKPVDPTKLNKALNDLKERYVTMEPITDPNHVLQMGDACTVNMVGYMATDNDTKGEPLPNAASGDRVEVILGSGRYMEGLVEGLVGAKVGDTVEIRVTFPDVCTFILSYNVFLSMFIYLFI
jgi:trigger factor